MRSLFFLGGNYSKIMVWKIWSIRLASKITQRNLLDLFLWGFMNDEVYMNSEPKVLELKPWHPTEIIFVIQKNLNNVLICLENRLHAVDREPCGHTEHQGNSSKSALLDCRGLQSSVSYFFGNDTYSRVKCDVLSIITQHRVPPS